MHKLCNPNKYTLHSISRFSPASNFRTDSFSILSFTKFGRLFGCFSVYPCRVIRLLINSSMCVNRPPDALAFCTACLAFASFVMTRWVGIFVSLTFECLSTGRYFIKISCCNIGIWFCADHIYYFRTQAATVHIIQRYDNKHMYQEDVSKLFYRLLNTSFQKWYHILWSYFCHTSSSRHIAGVYDMSWM